MGQVPTALVDDFSEDDTGINSSKSASDEKLPIDPLRWFGILVPSALRATQTSFTAAVEGPVPELINIVAELRKLENEIRKTRKTIKKSSQ